MQRVVLLGAPGAGKSTQGVALAEHLGVPSVSSGELLRGVRAESPRDREIALRLDRGELVPDDLVSDHVLDELVAAVTAGGYVLEGFPRTIGQARRLDEVAPPRVVVHLALPDDVALERLAGRVDGARTDDDDPTVARRRLRVFREEIEPLLDFYERRGLLTTVDASGSPEDVGGAILDVLDSSLRADD